MRFTVRIAAALAVLLAPLSAHAQPKKLGWLSKEEEVAKGGAETISPGKFPALDPETKVPLKDDKGVPVFVEDKGGPSYGSYQLASKRGIDGSSVSAFVKEYYAKEFQDPVAAAKGETRLLDPIADKARFDKKYLEVVKSEGDLFLNNEHEFIADTHYHPVAKEVLKRTGLDASTRSDALRNVLWSVAVQHGPPSDPKATGVAVFEKALAKWTKEQLAAKPSADGKTGVSDDDLIKAVYAERGRKTDDGKSAYFGKLDLSKRFTREQSKALDARNREERDAADLNNTKMGKFAKEIGIIAAPVRRKSPDLFVTVGQPTFDFSGFDGDFDNTRKPAVPNDRSGVRFGRGYDLGRRAKAEIEADLDAAGLPALLRDLYAGAAGLKGFGAREYLGKFQYGPLSKAARDLGLKGPDFDKYIREHSPQPITLPQQKKLFERTYAQAIADAKDKLFEKFQTFPTTAKDAIVDLVFDRGPEAIRKEMSTLVEAVQAGDWAKAAAASKRHGAGTERNTAIREWFEAAVAPMPKK